VGLFALAAVVLISLGGVAGWYGLYRNTYATDIGEQRSIVLADGSSLELNSRSRVRIRYTQEQRDVDLLEGQALFRVAHEAKRPFVVHSGTTRVLAVGTQFDVYKKAGATVVTVVDGKVEVLVGAALATSTDAPRATPLPLAGSKSLGSEAVFLAAGEQLTVPAGKPVRATNPSPDDSSQMTNVAAATAWTQHKLVFESAPLTEVAQEFNRYNRRPLVITDPEIASMRISGMFSSADPALILKFLRTQPELTLEETDTEIRISKR
jgi:transmembrane sensor